MDGCFDGRPVRRIERQDGVCSFWMPAEGALVSRTVGYLRYEFAHALLEMLVPMLRHDTPIAEFHDWYEMDRYDLRCQADLTAWHARNRCKVQCLDILCRSNLVRMGVSVANLPLRGLIRLYDHPQPFAAEARKVLSARPFNASHS